MEYSIPDTYGESDGLGRKKAKNAKNLFRGMCNSGWGCGPRAVAEPGAVSKATPTTGLLLIHMGDDNLVLQDVPSFRHWSTAASSGEEEKAI